MSKQTEKLKAPSNLDLWDLLAETDPKYTKNFKRSGGFSGTAQNPTYAIKKMTEHFGMCGKGWGFDKPEFTLHDAGDQGVIVYSSICLWYMDSGQRCEVFGVGGDMVVANTKYGMKTDDEAFKKATTDALTNAMKSLGMAADLHLGMYDDSKYMNGLKDKYSEPPKPEHSAKYIAEKLLQATTLEALRVTWTEVFGADLTLYKTQDAKAYSELEQIKENQKTALLKATQEQAAATTKQVNGKAPVIDDEIVY